MARLTGVEQVETDVLVIGGGFAGLWAALAAREHGQRVLLIDKGYVTKSGCSAFLAGILLVCLPGEDHSVWLQEMVEQGEYLNHQEWIKIYLEQSYERAVEIDRWGKEYGEAIFEKDDQGDFLRRKSRGHIKTYHLLANPQPYMHTLKKKARQQGVDIMQRIMMTDLVCDGNRVLGALGFDYRRGTIYFFKARAVVMAAGGSGFKGIFVGHKNITGDSIAAACRAGVILQNMENVQSNTCSAEYDIHGMNLMVGIGGKFLNALGEEFMWKYSPVLGNRANLHELVLAFAREALEGRAPIYLDATAASAQDRELCRKILPGTFQVYDAIGYSPLDQPMKWVPAPKGHMSASGGVRIDCNCATNIEGLFAAGDTAWNAISGCGGGPNGKAAGFAIVSGYRAGYFAGEAASRFTRSLATPAVADMVNAHLETATQPLLRTDGSSPDRLIEQLQQLLFTPEHFYIKSESRIDHVLAKLIELREPVASLQAHDLHQLVKCNEVRNMLLCAEVLYRSAQVRKESRGFHFVEEYPVTDNINWLKHVLLQQTTGGEMKLWTEDVDTPYLEPPRELCTPAGIRRDC